MKGRYAHVRFSHPLHARSEEIAYSIHPSNAQKPIEPLSYAEMLSHARTLQAEGYQLLFEK